MSIILEGFDNSGKTTLANAIGWPIRTTGGPPKPGETVSDYHNLQLAQADQDVIIDRVTCISHQVYQKHMFDAEHMSYVWRMMQNGATIVYCRPPLSRILDFGNHEAKDHDTPEHLADIEANAKQYIKDYDILMRWIPHIKYDYVRNISVAVFVQRLKELATI